MDASLSETLGNNMRQLRETRGVTQARMAELAGIPRATWANLESGAGNPTLLVLQKVATALSVSLEELVARPRASARRYAREQLPTRQRGGAIIRTLLPDPIPGMVLDRMELPARVRMTGSPHTPGTREYLTCEKGRIQLIASGEQYVLEPGDVVVFRGDQKHSYVNATDATSIGYSVVVLAPPLN
jgi:XRE family transcriptional regulator, regulator of sulfur utilization